MNSLNKNLRIGVMGASLDTGNMGVSALAASVLQLLKNHYPQAEIYMFIGNRSKDPQIFTINNKKIPIPVINFRNSPKAKLSEQLWFIFLLSLINKLLPFSLIRKQILKRNRWLRELQSMDMIGEIWGGDSFSDIYGLPLFILTSLPVITAILLGRPVILLPQTYGPYKNPLSRLIARYILRHCKKILSRDKESITLVKKLFNNKHPDLKINFCPDVAFTLLPIPPKKTEIYPPLPDLNKKTIIGFNINGLMYNGGYTGRNMFGLNMDYREFVDKMLVSLLAMKNTHILLVPHNFGPAGNINSDPDACYKALDNVADKNEAKRVHMFMRQYDQSEIKNIISVCKFFIGSRMHSCIAALSQGIPTAGVAYSKKFKGVFDSVGAGQGVIDARVLTAEQSVEKILEQIHNKSSIGKQTGKIMNEVKKDINSVFQSLALIQDDKY